MINSRDISELHPTLQRGARELISRMNAQGFPVGISSTYRSIEYQNHLFEQGRSRPGQIVTNARGGQSIHNYRLAFDIFKNVRGQEFSNARFFDVAGRIWQEMGGVWGGSWVSFPDRPHFEFTGGLSLACLQRGATMPQNQRMPWETQLVPEREEEVESKNEGEEEEAMRFNNLEDLPEWALDTVKKLIREGHLRGTGNDLDLSLDMLRLLVINDRAGLFK